MAYERISTKELYTGKLQAASGSAETPTIADDALNLARLQITPVAELLEIESGQPELSTEVGVIGMIHHQVECAAYLRQSGLLSSPPVTAELPRELARLLPSAGWKLVTPASGKRVTWYYTGEQAGFLTLWQREIVGQDVEGLLKKAYDTVLDWRYADEPGKARLFEFTGVGRVGTVTSLTERDSSPYGGSVTYQGGAPMVSKAQATRIVNLANDAVFGGGSLSSPSYAVCILQMSLQGNRNVQPVPCGAADGGIKYGLGEFAPITGSMTFEYTGKNDWDLYELYRSRQPIEFRRTTPTAVAGVVCHEGGYLVLTSLPQITVARGHKIAQVNFRTVAPEDASDGSPAAAKNPGQKFTAGTNAGIPTSDGSSAPAGAHWYLQLEDTN